MLVRMVLAARGEMVVLADPGVVVAASSVPRRNADMRQRHQPLSLP